LNKKNKTMKNLLLVALLLTLGVQTLAQDRVKIFLYFESLCPGCKEFITSSFKEAVYTANFEKICDYQLFPYGNAREKFVDGKWVFTCQHGPNECYGNLVETCALAKIKFNDNYKFIICLEEEIDRVSGWDAAVQKCAPKFGVDQNALYACIKGDEGNKLQHEIAQATDALKPAHQYVPWITFNGAHTTKDETQIESNMVDFACSHYTGPEKIAACNSGSIQAPKKLVNRCRRSSPLYEIIKGFENK